MLSKGKPRDAAVNFDVPRIFQRHRAVSLSQHGFLVYISNRLHTEITQQTRTRKVYSQTAEIYNTRKPCYGKDDRAMRPTYRVVQKNGTPVLILR